VIEEEEFEKGDGKARVPDAEKATRVKEAALFVAAIAGSQPPVGLSYPALLI
jgi:hypothetical protein